MARRLTPPFRADHVGSLLRPPEIWGSGPYSPMVTRSPTRISPSRTVLA
jgi:hypothetical protein